MVIVDVDGSSLQIDSTAEVGLLSSMISSHLQLSLHSSHELGKLSRC